MVCQMSKTAPRLRIEPAAPDERADALHQVFGHLAHAERTSVVAALLEGAAEQEIAIEGLLAARRDDRLVGAVWVQVQPGASAVVWPPGIQAEEPGETAAALLGAASEFLATQPLRIAQALLPEREGEPAERLKASGFAHLTDLSYLVSMEAAFPLSPPASGLEFETYSSANHARLVELIPRTYEQTQDCPQLNGVRQIGDVLDGYRATGVFAPERWMLIRQVGEDIGCLLLADHPGAQQWELVYMGIVPEARGQGLGVQIARYAQWLTRLARRARLVLAVDTANEPALAMYTQAGFLAWQHRSVFLRVLEGPRARNDE
jgi:ribosomal protein S18 acetylase RimI-like enzyme